MGGSGEGIFNKILIILLFLIDQSAVAGTYTIYSNPAAQTVYNSTATTGNIDATYYRDVTASYNYNTSCGFFGYLTAHIKADCDGTVFWTDSWTVSSSSTNGSKTDSLTCCTGAICKANWVGTGWACGTPSKLVLFNLVVAGIKDLPTVANQSASVNENASTGLVAVSASDPQLAPMTHHVTTSPAHGTLSWDNSQKVPRFNYTPTLCYSGTDSFKYTVTENIQNQSSTTTATVSLTVNPGTFPPSMTTLSNISIPWYAPTTINLSGIAKGACGGSTISVSATSSNTSVLPHPTVSYTSPNPTGNITLNPLQPTSVQGGSSTVTVTVNDGGGDLLTMTFTATVPWATLLR